MSFLSRTLGPSEFQLEIQKAFSLNWKIKLHKFHSIDYSFMNNRIKIPDNGSEIYLDFRNNQILVFGNISQEIFSNQEYFNIVKHDTIDDEYRFFMSTIYSDHIALTCTIKRKHISFESTTERWTSEIYTNNFINNQ